MEYQCARRINPFLQEKWDLLSSGSDTVKLKGKAIYNINQKSRIESKVMYAITESTPAIEKIETDSYGTTITTNTDDSKSTWIEAEVQYKYNILGGTGVYYGQNRKDSYTKIWKWTSYWLDSNSGNIGTEEVKNINDNYIEINYLTNFKKYFNLLKLYTSLYREYRNYTFKDGNLNYKDSPKERKSTK